MKQPELISTFATTKTAGTLSDCFFSKYFSINFLFVILVLMEIFVHTLDGKIFLEFDRMLFSWNLPYR